MGYRDNELTDHEQALGNLLVCGESLFEQHQRLQRSFQGLEHLVAVLVAALPQEQYQPLAQALMSDAERLAHEDVAREHVLRLAAVLNSRAAAPSYVDEPRKALQRGFHWLHELHPLKSAE